MHLESAVARTVPLVTLIHIYTQICTCTSNIPSHTHTYTHANTHTHKTHKHTHIHANPHMHAGRPARMQQCPFVVSPLPLSPQQVGAEQHMLTIYLHHSVLNCMLWGLYHAGTLRYSVQEGTIDKLHLTTDLLAMLIPGTPCACVCLCVCGCECVFVRVDCCVLVFVYTHTLIHTYAHTYTPSLTHTHTHSHTHTQICQRSTPTSCCALTWQPRRSPSSASAATRAFSCKRRTRPRSSCRTQPCTTHRSHAWRPI